MTAATTAAYAFDGVLHLRGDAGYESARVDPIFNGRKPDRYPVAILEAANEADVVAGVRMAAANGWKISVRAGGHSWAAWSVRDEALLIDLGRMRELQFATDAHAAAAAMAGKLDQDQRIVMASPSLQGGQHLAPFLAEHGYQFPGGHCSTVGLGGFVLQGGQGWNSRTWGWGCENLMAIDVVTADGSLIHASESQNSDLLWAARGAGPGFFGVVTRMYLRVWPKPGVMAQTTYLFPMSCFTELMTWAHAILPGLPTEVEPVIVAARTPIPFPPGVTPPPNAPDEGEPYLVMHTTCMMPTMEAAAVAMAPLETCPVLDRAIVRDFCQPTSIAEENPMMDAQNPKGLRYHTDCLWTDASAADLLPLLQPVFEGLPTVPSFSIWYGWSPKRPLTDMAFSMEGEVYVAVYAMCETPEEDDGVKAWLNARMAALAPVSKGLYLGDSDFTRRSAKFMADENLARLDAIRATYDPTRTFASYLIDAAFTLNA
jgi:FAD/FMN-containing dehydrogenase